MRTILVCFLFLFLVSCAEPIRNYFADSYFEQDRIYRNKALGFTLNYIGVWDIHTDANEMDADTRELARSLHTMAAELLFVGSTVEGSHGTRAIAANMNYDIQAYADTIRAINKESISADSGFSPFAVGSLAMVKWRYHIDAYEFVEFFFKVQTYNIRLAFWSRPDLFVKFLPVYEDIIRSISFD